MHRNGLKSLRRVIALGFFIGAAGCGTAAPPASAISPTTKEAFIEKFTRAYNTGDTNTILTMVNWRDVPDDLRPFVQNTLTAFAGTNKITEIDLVPWSAEGPVPGPDLPDGTPIIPNIQPQYWLVYKSSDGQERPLTVHLRWLVAQENDLFWLCGPKHDTKPKASAS